MEKGPRILLKSENILPKTPQYHLKMDESRRDRMNNVLILTGLDCRTEMPTAIPTTLDKCCQLHYHPLRLRFS